VEQSWFVLLEAAGDPAGTAIDAGTLAEMMELMACEHIVGLHDPFRYAIQLRIAAASPAEALFHASAQWQDAVGRLGLDWWPLQRCEVLTPAEFDRDQTHADWHGGLEVGVGVAGEGDDLLRSVFYDSLTGFPTLALFRDRALGVMSRAKSASRRLALLVLDVDGLAAVNRDLGYVYGDQVLVELAGRLTRQPDTTWAVARLAGDEFALLVDDTAGSAETRAADLLESLRAPMVAKGRAVSLTASVGLASVDDSADIDEHLNRAGQAMCAAKAAGGDSFRWYEARAGVECGRLEFVAHGVPDRLAYVMLLERAALAANECSSLEEAAAIVLRQVIAHTGWRAGHLWLVSEDRARLEPSGVWHVSGPELQEQFRELTEGWTLTTGEGQPGAVLASGKPEWATTGEPASAYQKAALDAGLSAAAAFPVLAGTEVVAVLGFFATRPISLDDTLLEVMACVGAQLGRIFERTRAAAELARSEERYRTLADSLPELIWASGTTGEVTFVNRPWLEFTGRAAEQEVGYGWAESVHKEDLARCMQTYLNAFDRREPFEMEYRLLRADGQYRWLLDRGTPVFEAGNFAGYVGGCIDITDRRRAQIELRNEEVRFRSLVENADVMIVVLGSDGSLIDEFLPSTALGYPPGEGQGRLGFDYLHPDDLDRAVTEFARALAHPGPVPPFECRVRHADGTWRWLRAVANNMLDHPLIHGIVVSATDITEQKVLADMLQAAEERLRQVEKRLQDDQGADSWTR